MVFVNSMSDMFHKKIDKGYIDRVFSVMEEVDRHIYQILTKRSSLMLRYIQARYGKNEVPGHIWPGVSVEDAAHKKRIEHLRQINSGFRFISFEPLLGPIGAVDLNSIAWAIVGGESGPRARPMKESWVIELRDQCRKSKTAFFFKQWGGLRPKSGGRLLKKREWNEIPNRKIKENTSKLEEFVYL